MKFGKKHLLLLWILALIPLAVTAALYGRLPERIPAQWGFDGSVRYDPKSSIWMTVMLGPLFALLIPLMAKIDPRKRNYQKFAGVYQGFAAVLLLFLGAMNGIVLSESLYPGQINVAKMVTIGCGLLFVWLGNVMPRVRSNFFFGFKNPWTLSSPRVWEKAHRLGGYLFFGGGILMILLSLLLPPQMISGAFFALMLTICLIPSVMSYFWYKRLGDKGQTPDESIYPDK